jgi:hypothetical protein
MIRFAAASSAKPVGGKLFFASLARYQADDIGHILAHAYVIIVWSR